MKLDKNKQFQQKIADLEDKWKRAVADYHNLEKRVQTQQIEFVKFANATLITRLLSIVDDLNRAVDHLQDQGLQLIISQLKDLLKTEGVTEIAAANLPFNAHTMEAVDTVTGPKDQVVAVVTTGYMLGDKVLRPARVTVGQGESSSSASQNNHQGGK